MIIIMKSNYISRYDSNNIKSNLIFNIHIQKYMIPFSFYHSLYFSLSIQLSFARVMYKIFLFVKVLLKHLPLSLISNFSKLQIVELSSLSYKFHINKIFTSLNPLKSKFHVHIQTLRI